MIVILVVGCDKTASRRRPIGAHGVEAVADEVAVLGHIGQRHARSVLELGEVSKGVGKGTGSDAVHEGIIVGRRVGEVPGSRSGVT